VHTVCKQGRANPAAGILEKFLNLSGITLGTFKKKVDIILVHW